MRILKIICCIALVLLPFSTVLSNFSPYWVPGMTFQTYLTACFVFAVLSIVLGIFVAEKGKLFSVFGLLFFLGMLIAPPFLIGPPELSPKLLELKTEEHFRYGMLLFATVVFGIGALLLVSKYWKEISGSQKLIVIPIILCFVIMIWDNYSSYQFSSEMEKWIASGKKAESFATEFNFNELWRTLGRTLIYIIIPWLGLILLGFGRIKKWQLIVLSIFCFVGILFFFLTNFIGMQFYFPFMVPAIALAPAYWLGIALITKK